MFIAVLGCLFIVFLFVFIDLLICIDYYFYDFTDFCRLLIDSNISIILYGFIFFIDVY